MYNRIRILKVTPTSRRRRRRRRRLYTNLSPLSTV
jgi:hypothetical protein